MERDRDRDRDRDRGQHWLACHLGDQVVVAVEVQHLGTVQFGGCGDDPVRDRAPVTTAAMLGKQPPDLRHSCWLAGGWLPDAVIVPTCFSAVSAHFHGAPAAGPVAGGIEEPQHASRILAAADPRELRDRVECPAR